MDLVLRYFNSESCLVETSYFDSAFIKRPNSHNLYDKLLESLSTLDLRKLLQELMDRSNSNWDVLKLHSSYREQNEFSKWPTLVVVAFLCYTVPYEQDWWKQIRKSNFYMQCEKLVVIFFLCIFARPDGLKMNPLLHEEFRYGRILSRLWSTGFHCQKVNVHVITSHLIPWLSTMQINWWSPSSIF